MWESLCSNNNKKRTTLKIKGRHEKQEPSRRKRRSRKCGINAKDDNEDKGRKGEAAPNATTTGLTINNNGTRRRDEAKEEERKSCILRNQITFTQSSSSSSSKNYNNRKTCKITFTCIWQLFPVCRFVLVSF